MVLERLSGVDRQLDNRYVSVGKDVREYGPGAVVETQLSWSSPAQLGFTTSTISSATSGAPGAGYSTANSSSGNP